MDFTPLSKHRVRPNSLACVRMNMDIYVVQHRVSKPKARNAGLDIEPRRFSRQRNPVQTYRDDISDPCLSNDKCSLCEKQVLSNQSFHQSTGNNAVDNYLYKL